MLNHKNKQLFCLFILLFCLNSFGISDNQSVTIYSHGFGETAIPSSMSGPLYHDSAHKVFDRNSDQFLKFSFYSRQSVVQLAEHIKNQLDENPQRSIQLVGRSAGAGVAINMLAKLAHYDASYFKGTCVTSQDDANRILQAINKGGLELSVPLLNLEKTEAIDYLATFGLPITIIGSAGFFRKNTVLAIITALCAAYKGNDIKNGCSKLIDRCILPVVSRGTYDPTLKPIDVVELLKNKLTCPVFIQVCKHDGVVKNSPEDIARLYAALRAGNENNTHIFVSTDAGHNGYSYSYMDFRTKADKGKPLTIDQLLQQLR